MTRKTNYNGRVMVNPARPQTGVDMAVVAHEDWKAWKAKRASPSARAATPLGLRRLLRLRASITSLTRGAR